MKDAQEERAALERQQHVTPRRLKPDDKTVDHAIIESPHALRELAADIRSLIEAARLRVAQTVNAELVLLYWQIGDRIYRDILGQARAEYGE